LRTPGAVDGSLQGFYLHGSFFEKVFRFQGVGLPASTPGFGDQGFKSTVRVSESWLRVAEVSSFGFRRFRIYRNVQWFRGGLVFEEEEEGWVSGFHPVRLGGAGLARGGRLLERQR